jgi:hypothetical protein
MAEFKLDIIGASIIGDTDRVKELVEQGEDVNTIGSTTSISLPSGDGA